MMGEYLGAIYGRVFGRKKRARDGYMYFRNPYVYIYLSEKEMKRLVVLRLLLLGLRLAVLLSLRDPLSLALRFSITFHPLLLWHWTCWAHIRLRISCTIDYILDVGYGEPTDPLRIVVFAS